MVVEQEHPQAGLTRTIGMPVKFSATPARYHRAAPRLGEDSVKILQELGFSADDIDAMIQDGIVADVAPSLTKPAARPHVWKKNDD